jgi:hypothetical protein
MGHEYRVVALQLQEEMLGSFLNPVCTIITIFYENLTKKINNDLNNFLAGNIVMEGTGAGEKNKKDFSYVNFLLELLGNLCLMNMYIYIYHQICSL